MEYRIIIFIMIVVSVALGMFVGRFILPKADGVLIVDDHNVGSRRLYIKPFNPETDLAKKHCVYLVVTRSIREGDAEWPNER